MSVSFLSMYQYQIQEDTPEVPSMRQRLPVAPARRFTKLRKHHVDETVCTSRPTSAITDCDTCEGEHVGDYFRHLGE